MADRGFFVFLILVAAGQLSTGCTSLLDEPEISVSGIVLSSVSLSETAVDVVFSVDNPNPVGLTLKSLSFDVYTKRGNEWVHLSHGEKSGVEIAPGLNEVSVPVVVDNSELVESAVEFFVEKEIVLQVEGVVTPDILGIAPEIPFTHTTSVPLNVPFA